MSLTPSTMLPLGSQAPDFNLPDSAGNMVSISDFKDTPALLVVFMCNHCPYVKHVRPVMVPLVKEYQKKGVAVIAINSNDSESYPDDSPEKMRKDQKEHNYSFPYLIDESQRVAKAFRAACTPDIFLFDKDKKLAYRGQMDGSRPGNNVPITGQDLRHAMDAVLEGRSIDENQKPSMGCNIKWKPGNEPDYFNSK
jgi:peroxiredoxin